MSKITGDKSRANRQQKHKMLMRKHSRELGKPSEGKATMPNSAEAGNHDVSGQSRQLTVDGKAAPADVEIVVAQSAQGVAND